MKLRWQGERDDEGSEQPGGSTDAGDDRRGIQRAEPPRGRHPRRGGVVGRERDPQPRRARRLAPPGHGPLRFLSLRRGGDVCFKPPGGQDGLLRPQMSSGLLLRAHTRSPVHIIPPCRCVSCSLHLQNQCAHYESFGLFRGSFFSFSLIAMLDC